MSGKENVGRLSGAVATDSESGRDDRNPQHQERSGSFVQVIKTPFHIKFCSILTVITSFIGGQIIKFVNLMLEGLFIMNLYQLDKQSTKFTIWKYRKGCVKTLDGNVPNFLPTTHGSCIKTMHLLTGHCL